jgi:hypothetical protein
MTKGGSVILRIYFSLVAFVTLMMLIFSISDLVNLTLKTFVFPAADRASYYSYCDRTTMTETACDEQRARDEENALVQKQQQAVRDLSLLIVSAPLFWLHFRIVYRDWMEEKMRRDDEDGPSPKKKKA